MKITVTELTKNELENESIFFFFLLILFYLPMWLAYVLTKMINQSFLKALILTKDPCN